MLNLARVRFDPFEMDAVGRLQTELASKNIGLVLDPSYTLKDKPILNYINPHIRIDGVDNVLYHHERIKCNTIISRNIPVSFMPVENKYPFYSAASLCFYCKPPVDAIPILMITHARHLYLELTLNALAFSITFDPQIPVHILMSKPTEEVKKVVLKFKNRLNLHVYETEENVCFAGFNMLLQHVKPEKFIILEEDFILPQHIKSIMPYWNRIFNERLNYFDVVGFSTSVENVSADHFSIGTTSDTKQTFLYDWKNNSGHPHVTGNTLCTTTKHYVSMSDRNGPFYICPDGVLMTKSKWSICSITGYHIGFNQEMDIAVSLQSNRFPNPAVEQTLFDYQKNESFKYVLTDIYKILD
jgi:hypothetical protein